MLLFPMWPCSSRSIYTVLSSEDIADSPATAFSLTPSDPQPQASPLPYPAYGRGQSRRSSTVSTPVPDTKARYRPPSQTTTSSIAERYRSSRPPEHEQDARPLSPLEIDEDEDESRAMASPTLPPVYSSISAPTFTYRPPERAVGIPEATIESRPSFHESGRRPVG